MSEDGRKAIAKDVETTHEAGQDVYRAAETYANSDEMDLFDFGKSVSDNRKLTGLKNDLLSSQEGLDLLKDLKSTDADKVLAAQAEISKLAQEKYGLTPEQVNFYDADKTTSVAMQDNDVRDVHGGVVTDDDHELHGEVNVDISDATTKTELLNTLGHETYESITENTTGEQTAAQEDLANAFGNQLEDRVNQAAGGDLDSTVDDNWNSSLVNSSTVNSGTERVNKVGDANVDHMVIPLPSPALTGAAGASGGTTTVTKNQLNDAANDVKATVDAVADTVIGGINFDPKFDDKELEPQIKVITGLLKDLEDDSRSAEFKIETLHLLEQYDPKAVKLAKERAEAISPNTGGQPIPDPLPMPSGSKVKDPEAVVLVTPEADNIDSTTVTPISEEQGATILVTPADTGVDPLLVAASTNSNKDNAGFVFEPNPKHGKNQRGNANPEPTNPQRALDSSIKLSENSTRRVSVDKETGEYVVFDEHLPNKFHGHIRTWEELDQKMQAKLRKAGLVNKKGKIQ